MKMSRAEVFPEHPIPSAWSHGNYLALLFRIGPKKMHVISTLAGEALALSASEFAETFGSTPRQDLNPHYLALNVINRSREGLIKLHAWEERELIAMLNKEELSKMSERQLAAEYIKVMGSGPKRIHAEDREKRIDEILAKLAGSLPANEGTQEAPKRSPRRKKSSEPTTEGEESTMAAKTSKTKSKPAKTTKAKGKSESPKAAKEPKRSAEERVAAGENPFREGSMKREAFAYYLRTMERKKIIAKMIEIGTTESTANTWYSGFCKLSPKKD